MDNFTHSLFGAVLGRMGLKRLTGRAMPALILSANLPDIDSFVAPLVGEEPIAFHRGFTHGVGGWLLMPLVAAAIILLWERFRPGKETVRPWWLLLVCLAGTLSHPLLDLMNTYGVQLLEPLADGWFYADTLFIIDPWIWIALILGLELSWRAERLGRNWTAPAIGMFALVAAYTGANLALSTHAEGLTKRELQRRGERPTMTVASPVPLQFWVRRMLWRDRRVAGSGTYDPFAGLKLDPGTTPLNLGDPALAAAIRHNRYIRAFLYWSRMPMVTRVDGRPYLTDQRFLDRPRRRPRPGNFLVPLDNRPPSP